MSKHQQYWRHEVHSADPFIMELRATLAWQLIQHFGAVAATRGTEDAAGRATLDLQKPEELVARAFSIADAFVNEAEGREELRANHLSPEDRARATGDLQRIETAHHFNRTRDAEIVGTDSRRFRTGDSEPVAVPAS